jgi:hypothetical protein
MSTFTPGPWRFDRFGYVLAPDGRMEVQVAKVGDFHDKELLPFNKDRWTADARLIAQAPQMREALEGAHRCLADMIFMAEAAEHHSVAAGDIERAKRSLAEIASVLNVEGQ